MTNDLEKISLTVTKTPILSAQSLRVQFDDNIIFKDVSFEVSAGEVFVILGTSGCGKSTLLKALTGLVIPSDGNVYYDGTPLYGGTEDEIKKCLRTFGILFQSGGLFASMSLFENVALPLRSYTTMTEKQVEETVIMKLGAVGLAAYADYLPSEISGGMKKRAGLARAMALDPEILFCDEPSAGLDPVSSASLDELILNIAKSLGTAIVVVTHELESIRAIADRVLMLDKADEGTIAYGTLQEVMSNPDERIHKFFNRIA